MLFINIKLSDNNINNQRSSRLKNVKTVENGIQSFFK